MSAPTISALPTVPSRNAPSTFSSRMDAFLAAFPTFRTDANALAAYLDNLAVATGPGLFPNGSLAFPSISFSSDTATGFRRTVTGAFAVVTGGADRMLFNASGAVLTGLLSGTAVTQTATDATANRLMKVGDSATILSASPANRLTSGGTANAITVTSGAAISGTPPTGMRIRFRPTVTNTGATTLALDGGSPIACRTITLVALPAGYIRTNADTVAEYNGTNWVLQREVEYGTNANGDFVQFADGTQICTHVLSASASAAVTWTYPSGFSTAPIAVGAGTATSPRFMTADSTVSSNMSFSLYNELGVRTAQSARLTATGRWF